jgi:two-component sensor histidine kinase
MAASKTSLRDPARLAALDATGLLDSPVDESFDRMTRLLVRLLEAPVALVSLVDGERQFFKSQVGLSEPWASQRETPLSHSFCQHVVTSGEALIVENAPEHPVVCDNRAVTELGVAAYLGVPLTTPSGQVLGSLCVVDTKPRQWRDEEVKIIRDVAEIVMREIALRREIHYRKSAEAQQELLIGELHHRVKNTLAVVQGLIALSLRTADSFSDFSSSIGGRIVSLANTHTLLVDRQWLWASLRELLEGELKAYAEGERIVLDGPDAILPSQNAVALGMVVHELITNAIKHGALSTEQGQVHLTWMVAPTEAGDRLTLDWIESGGPAVSAPRRRGFGTMLLDRVLSPQLHGKITTDFQPDGLRVRIETLLSMQDGAEKSPSS